MTTILSTAVLLFLVMDPLGNVPLYISTLQTVSKERRFKVLVREVIIALVALLLFLFLGAEIIAFLGIRTESISIAGGIILFLISLKMLFPATRPEVDDQLEGEPMVVPLAIPLFAGPSALATVLLLAGQAQPGMVKLTIALLLAWAVSALILMSSTFLHRVLGERGLIAMERLMGMVLVALAVQMFLDGVASYLSLN